MYSPSGCHHKSNERDDCEDELSEVTARDAKETEGGVEEGSAMIWPK